ncbi:MAG: fructose-1,6-bisphosphatase [Ardenticatenaceae bacterium]|nr:fructose-1,6-bisphosphatase [Ardenticatenaceae bacterium]
MEITNERLEYLQLLAQKYPSIQAASTEIIDLSAKLQLPKGTEHFVSDIHGEYEAFAHVLKNGSGSIKRRIDELFVYDMDEKEKRTLATLIYYPEKKLAHVLPQTDNPEAWYRITLFRLIRLCRNLASKYTRADVRAALPDDFTNIIEELLHEQEGSDNKHEYYRSIINTIIATGQAGAFIVALAELIQRLAIARLHVIGDIYDRGPGAHIIMDMLMAYHELDIQWGNHDIVWMGAAAGSAACMANVIRAALRYANMETLEHGYALSMLPLATFAMDVYGDDPCELFQPKISGDEQFTQNEIQLMAKMHKAITIIQLKLEAQIIQRRPHFEMQDRLLLDKIDFAAGTVAVNGRVYPLLDTHFPTIDPDTPYELTPAEANTVARLQQSFAISEKLQQHIRFLFSRGSMYLVYNGNLLYHGCIAMEEDGSFMSARVAGQEFAGKAFMDRLDRLARQGYFSTEPAEKRYGQDVMWYLWSGAKSPIFGKNKMATFERYFIADESTHKEEKNAYFAWRDKEETAVKILREFGLDPATAHIINGHVPVQVRKGESPIKAGGKLLVIDGGLAKAYHKITGIAGYTLIFNSYGLLLASHDPFESQQLAIEEGIDMQTQTEILESNRIRIRVKDTDEGRAIQQRINNLKDLLSAYRTGLIKEG